MISNLPLLFADGQPTCLEKITASQLEKFVPFMIQCSSGQSDVRKLTAPPWWPSGLQFSIPLSKPSIVDSKWLFILKNLVYRCYAYHECDFMLRFCSDLSQLSTSELKYVNSWDGTTSLYNKVTGKLLVTFRNENLFYDKKRSSPKKTLLSRSNGESGLRQGMVQPPLYDVYLCDNCDEEFNTLKEVQEHEKTCCREHRDPSPPSCVNEECTKESFLNYFHLCSSKNKDKKIGKINPNTPLRKRGFRSNLRYSSIPVSSPLGVIVYKKTKPSSSPSVQLERQERHCQAKPHSANAECLSRERTSWPVSWKPRRKGVNGDWVHVYKKPGRYWRKKTSRVPMKLCDKTLNLLNMCRNVKVQVRKLTPHEISFYTSTHSDSNRAADKPAIQESKSLVPLVRRHSTNSLHATSEKLSNSTIEITSLKQYNIHLPNSVEIHPTFNGKIVNIVKPLCNDNSANGKRSNIKQANESPKTTKTNCPVLSSVLSQVTCEYPSQNTISQAVSCELTCIPVIDLVSSDEECEII